MTIRTEAKVAGKQSVSGIAGPESHRYCFVCGSANGDGLSLEFTTRKDGAIGATFSCDRRFEGYSGCVHGGVIASLLDGAMTNCMFRLGRTAMTAELKVRFHYPLLVGDSAAVSAWIESHAKGLYLLEAEIVQEGLVKARAWGKFLGEFDQ